MLKSSLAQAIIETGKILDAQNVPVSKPPPPLPNRVAEMLALADAIAVWKPPVCRVRRGNKKWIPGYYLVQMRWDLPQRGSVAVESHGGWTYKQFADALKELLE